MLKKVLSTGLIIALFYGVYYFISSDDESSTLVPTEASKALQEISGLVSANSTEEIDPSSLDLALKTILLSQGERGVQLWRLKATAASMVKEKGVIKLNAPRLVYYMQPENTELIVNSDRGDINQSEQLLRFIGNVVVTHLESNIAGQLLVYNGTEKTMTFPDGGNFRNPAEGSTGSADRIVWYLNKQTIEGIGNVDVVFGLTKEPAVTAKKNTE